MNHDGRYAPSPTGPLHLGNLRTAMLAWLFARSAGAMFTLRIEDLDPDRSRPEMVEEHRQDLKRLGLDWDRESPPQSERGERYSELLGQLEDRGLVYECYCSRREIREASVAPEEGMPEGAYPGTCRDLSEAERAERRDERPAALRAMAANAEIEFVDRMHGLQKVKVDDFVVRRNDGAFAYNLATTVDDADQQVGEVVRGRDLLETTGRQIWLAQVLGLRAPESWVHVPLVLGSDGRPLSKRNEDTSLSGQIRRGHSVDAVRHQLARSLGLAAGTQPPTMQEVLERFNPAMLPAVDAPLSVEPAI